MSPKRFTINKCVEDIRIKRQECLKIDEEFYEKIIKLQPYLNKLNSLLQENDDSAEPKLSDCIENSEVEKVPILRKKRSHSTIKRIKYLQKCLKTKDTEIKFFKYSLDVVKIARDNFVETLCTHAEIIEQLRNELKRNEILISRLRSRSNIGEDGQDVSEESFPRIETSFSLKNEPMYDDDGDLFSVAQKSNRIETTAAVPQLLLSPVRNYDDDDENAWESVKRLIKQENAEVLNEKHKEDSQGSFNLTDLYSDCSNVAAATVADSSMNKNDSTITLNSTLLSYIENNMSDLNESSSSLF